MTHLGATVLLWWPVVVTVMIVSGICASATGLLVPDRTPAGIRAGTGSPAPAPDADLTPPVPSQGRAERARQAA